MGFKEDADFARFVSMGAVGAAAVARHLNTRHEHRMIELERYALANKVWRTKVKRLRLPDLVCVRCGLRVEARAKSKLGIVLSHSDTPGRQWDAGGMRDHDLYAFLRVDPSRFPPETGAPAFFTQEALRSCVEHARRSAPKAASEGSEATLTWPCWIPSGSGRFVGVDQDRISYRDLGGRERSYWQWRRWAGKKITYMEPDEPFEGGETIVAGIVPRPDSLACQGDAWNLVEAVRASSDADVYAAVKAAGVSKLPGLEDALSSVRADCGLDWRVRLEAAASLARHDGDKWIGALTHFVDDAAATAEQRMEAVLALSELPTSSAADALLKVATDTDQRPELRAAATWGLGQGATPRPEMLLKLTQDDEQAVALHAIAAIDRLTEATEDILVEWLVGADERRGEVAAHLLSRHQRIGALLGACELGDRARVRSLSALGHVPRETVRLAAGQRLTPRISRILEPMWHSQESRLRTADRDGLEALEVQKVRFDPTSPGDPWETGVDNISCM